ncbi:MAG TPA: trypsin-like peptidase domain-containing protein [Candidatus Limnocylindria bacterium]|nr:trypsin-like peptidase domain-containing protein [Candidatus Limnocylindria bacterium]
MRGLRFVRGGGWLCLFLLGIVGMAAEGAAEIVPGPARDSDIRRDATVIAVEKVLPAVVNIEATAVRDVNDPDLRTMSDWFGWRYEPQYAEVPFSRGSGVVIDEEGYVLTNVHVIRDARRIFVKFNDGSEPIEAERVELSQRADVALLKLKAPSGRRFKAIHFAKDDDLLLGETVIALGNPFGLSSSVSKGILSSKARRGPARSAREKGADSQRQLDNDDWLQTDAAINPGNSGGPLVNLRGDLIGINVAVLRPDIGAQGIGFAIPIKRVQEALAEMLSGEAVRGYWFGAKLKPGVRPLTVQTVQPGSPAAQAGMHRDDLLLAVNGNPVDGIIEFNRALVAVGNRHDVALTVRRAGEKHELSLRLVEESSFFNNDLINSRLGFTVKTVGGTLVVSGVEPASPAAQAGLRSGIGLASVDGVAMSDLLQLAKYVYSKPKGAAIETGVIVYERTVFGVRQYEGSVTLKAR